MATTNAFCLASPPLARICLHGDLQRFGRRLSLYVNTAAEAIRALSLQVPGFRRQMNEGWYQIRIAGYDTAPEAVYARLHEQLGEGTVIHIVPRLAGAGKGGLQIVLGAAAIVGSFFTAGASMALWGSALAAGGFSATTMLFSLGASMILGGVAQMLAPKAKTPDYRATDNGRQNTYFSSLDNMIAQGRAAQVIMPHVVGSVEVYEQQTSWPLILENSQVVVLWGMNPLNTLKIAWSSTDEQGLEYFHQLKKSGKPVIAIDPIRTETIEFFGDNTTWIAPNMGTDVALMLGIAHTLMTQGKHDKVFLEKYTTGYPQFEEYLTGKSDNTPKSAAWAAEITGVPEAQIVKLAELMAANRTMLMAGWGIQRQQYGEQKHWMLVTLAAMLGQIGTPGGGFGFSYHYLTAVKHGNCSSLTPLLNPVRTRKSLIWP